MRGSYYEEKLKVGTTTGVLVAAATSLGKIGVCEVAGAFDSLEGIDLGGAGAGLMKRLTTREPAPGVWWVLVNCL